MLDLDSDNDETGFKINEGYAKRYEEWRNKEEFQKLKDRYGDLDLNGDYEESSTSESEDEDAREWNRDMEKDFLTTLSLVKSRDEKIYKKDEVLFKSEPNSSKNSDEKPKEKESKKPFLLKDLEREMILDKIEKGVSGDEDDDELAVDDNEAKKSYFEEQDEIKKSLKKQLKDDADGGDDFLKVKKKSQDEALKEDEEYSAWLKGKKKKLSDKKSESDMKFLKDYWSDPQLNESEKFLRDFILNKRYLDKDDLSDLDADERAEVGTEKNINLVEGKVDPETADLSEDEAILENQEQFERKYNFRFEEPDPEFIKSYPRTLSDSVRRKDNKRKLKREDYKQRKEAEKQKKREEIKRLKNLKKKEIVEKLEKIKQVTGNKELALHLDDLDKDFDADEYDRKMQQVFDSTYYNEGDVDEEKPEFSDSDLGIQGYDEDGYDGWDDDIGEDNVDDEADEKAQKRKAKKEKKMKKKLQESGENTDEFIMDCDVLDEMKEKQNGKKKLSKFKEAISKDKPKFDPSDKDFEKYFDEYYKLDCEDIIGDLACRFKYREVVPNNFGLEVDEILNADDKELNSWASLKKAVQYRPIKDELTDVRSYKDRAKNIDKKKKALQSFYNPKDEEKDEDEEQKEEVEANEETMEEKVENENAEVKKKDKKKKNKKDKESEVKQEVQVEEKSVKKNKEKRVKDEKVDQNKHHNKKGNNKNKKKDVLHSINEDRLQAYGINPKKISKEA